ncbi:metallo-beta-lactamase domain protein [Clostridium sp. CAG:964]|nr:metallo-beta-lactamase domain protein [Clostridium sp. CAG:964]
MNKTYISESIKYIGVDDRETDLFEGQYIIPNGVSYNSYVIFDEKIAVMDTVDKIATDKWVENLEKALNGKAPDYLVISHMEPDHASNVKLFAEKYPNAKLVGNAKTFAYMPQFFNLNVDDRKVVVKEGDTLELGQHTLTFIMAPMVHWPEVMVAYDSKDKVLFSADGFGKFGALDADEDWTCEARRYYFNIVGKYGAQVQALLKKTASLDIQTICPLHGPILNENLSYYIDKYDIWSSFRPEDKGVMIAYGSMHGNTKQAALELKALLEERGVQKVAVADLTRDDMAEAIEDAFRYDRLVVACPTYDGALFPAVEDFLYHLKIKNYQSRRVALIENGTWAPMAGKKMKEYFEGMKNITLCDTAVTVKSTLNEASAEQLKALADELADN